MLSWLAKRLVDHLDKVEVQFRNRRLAIDALQIVPAWMWSAAVWYLFTKLVLDRLSPNKPGTEINLAIIGGDLLPSWAGGEIVDLPPGVKIGALIDVTLAALDVIPDLKEFITKYPPGEVVDPSTAVNLLDDLFKAVIVGVGVITGVFRK